MNDILNTIVTDAKLAIGVLPAPVQQQLLGTAVGFVEGKMGMTPAQAAANVATSQDEHPEETPAWHRDDAIGKFKHELRGKIGGAVDVLWSDIESYAVALVDAIIAANPPVEPVG